jgi:TFIIF-interacting CTD phosphatase-like protein
MNKIFLPSPRIRKKEKNIDKCIILDLDETLVSTQTEDSSFFKLGLHTDPKYRDALNQCYYFYFENWGTSSGVSETMWGIKRPNLEEFLNLCFQYFTIVIVWSAGQKEYVDKIVKEIFRNTIRKPDMVFSWEHVHHPNPQDSDTFDKSISHLQKHIDSMYPKFSNRVNVENTIVVDDKLDNFKFNEDNGVLIPRYKPKLTYKGILENDGILNSLMDWITYSNIKYNNDVRNLDKTTIFK